MESSYKREIVFTEDGSSTIFHSSFNQHYHSIHGAISESQHVFMKMGWMPSFERNREQAYDCGLSVLEIGFGTGLNAFLVLLECLKEKNHHVTYTTLEAFPLDEKVISELNYAEQLNYPGQQENFLALHHAAWEIPVVIENGFSLRKRKIKLEDFIPVENSFDLIFFDAFSPEAQPELWTEEIFRKLYAAMKAGGMLVTYCAKGQVRRNLIAAGFSVERLEGPPGKREMLRAKKLQITG
jgi:tRNA U34 5-methylaminomethyl-2-thiouridine-forming methyltransferase MnmC